MNIIATAAYSAVLVQDGSSFRIPFDPTTDIIYVLLAITLFVIWYGDRQARKARREEEATTEADGSEDSPEERTGSGRERGDPTPERDPRNGVERS